MIMEREIKIKSKIVELNKKYPNDSDLGKHFRSYILDLVEKDETKKHWLKYCNDNPNNFKFGEKLRIYN